MEENKPPIIGVCMLMMIGTLLLALCCLSMMSGCCTLSFSNVMTSGTASDVVDSEPSTKSDPNIAPNVTLPVVP